MKSTSVPPAARAPTGQLAARLRVVHECRQLVKDPALEGPPVQRRAGDEPATPDQPVDGPDIREVELRPDAHGRCVRGLGGVVFRRDLMQGVHDPRTVSCAVSMVAMLSTEVPARLSPQGAGIALDPATLGGGRPVDGSRWRVHAQVQANPQGRVFATPDGMKHPPSRSSLSRVRGRLARMDTCEPSARCGGTLRTRRNTLTGDICTANGNGSRE